MSKLNLSLIIIPMLFVIVGCDKERLPKATRKGVNTFGCKIDGIVFKPYFTGGLFNNGSVLSGGNSRNFNLFGIHARNQETDQSVGIEFTYLRQAGTYQLRQYPYRGIYDAGYINPGWYTTDSVHIGELILTRCDTINKIYSGRFSFVAKDATGRLVKITEGRFDIKD